MINHMARRGADIIYGNMNPPVHVSGHASSEELKLILNLVRPRYFVPLHGEYWQLRKHARLAQPLRSGGLEEAFILETGQPLEIDHHGARKAGRIPVGPGVHRFRQRGRGCRGHGDPRPPPSFRGRLRPAHYRHQQAHRQMGGPAGNRHPRLRRQRRFVGAYCSSRGRLWRERSRDRAPKSAPIGD